MAPNSRRCPAHGDVQRVKRCIRRDEQAVAVQTAKGQVRNNLRQQDLAEQFTVRRVTMYAIERTGPDVAMFVHAHAIGPALLDLDELPAVTQFAACNIEHADMMWRVLNVRRRRIRDIDAALIWRECETVRLDEVI